MRSQVPVVGSWLSNITRTGRSLFDTIVGPRNMIGSGATVFWPVAGSVPLLSWTYPRSVVAGRSECSFWLYSFTAIT